MSLSVVALSTSREALWLEVPVIVSLQWSRSSGYGDHPTGQNHRGETVFVATSPLDLLSIEELTEARRRAVDLMNCGAVEPHLRKHLTDLCDNIDVAVKLKRESDTAQPISLDGSSALPLRPTAIPEQQLPQRRKRPPPE